MYAIQRIYLEHFGHTLPNHCSNLLRIMCDLLGSKICIHPSEVRKVFLRTLVMAISLVSVPRCLCSDTLTLVERELVLVLEKIVNGVAHNIQISFEEHIASQFQTIEGATAKSVMIRLYSLMLIDLYLNLSLHCSS